MKLMLKFPISHLGSRQQNTSKFSWFSKIFSGRPAIADAKTIFKSCQLQSGIKKWHTDGLVARDFRGQHSLMTTHVWMVHKKLLMHGDEGRRIQEALFDVFWDDTFDRIKAAGVHELSLNKRLSEVQGFSFKQCIEFDNALTKKNEDEIVEDIAGALWRATYNRKELPVEPDHVLEFARYVREVQLNILNQPIETIKAGVVHWGDIPWQLNGKYKKDKHGAFPGQNKQASQGITEEEWHLAVDRDGRDYYWNAKTAQVCWKKPSPKQKE